MDTHEKRERAVAGALLVSERNGQRALTESVNRATLRFASGLVYTPEHELHDDVTDEMQSLQDESEEDIIAIRTEARDASCETQRLTLNAVLTGTSKSAESIEARKRLAEVVARVCGTNVPSDAVSARMAAQSVSASWGASVARALAVEGDRSEKALRITRVVPGEVAGTVRRVATTEAASAHNDQVRRLHDALPVEVKDIVQLRWSAILDSRLCDRCAVKNGVAIVSVYPPLHKQCRCVALCALRAKAGRTAAQYARV